MQKNIEERCGQLEKLKKLLSRVKDNIYDKIIIWSEILTDVYTWIDAVYAVHIDMISHTGGAISMGYEMIHKSYQRKG